MPLALLIASRSMVLPCSVTTSRGMICTLAGRSASLVPVLPSDGACCSDGPGLLLVGPLPVSSTAAVCVDGFGAWLERTVLRRAAGFAAIELCFCAGRSRGASTCTGGNGVGFSCACDDPGTRAAIAMQKRPAQRYASLRWRLVIFGPLTDTSVFMRRAPHALELE